MPEEKVIDLNIKDDFFRILDPTIALQILRSCISNQISLSHRWNVIDAGRYHF